MRRFGLIGKTLKHSFSKGYFLDKFSREGIIDCEYENYELPSIGLLETLIKENPEIKGLNITIPYKEQIVRYLHYKNEIVKETGACNCIRISNGRLSGFNTDATGFKHSLNHQLAPHHKSALVLGSGGASKAITYALKELGIDFKIVSRNKIPGQLIYEEVDQEVMNTHHLIINTSPVGMFPNIDEEPNLPYVYLGDRHFLFDLIYNPPITRFLQQGKNAGSQIANGYEMLVMQAEESWKIWNET